MQKNAQEPEYQRKGPNSVSLLSCHGIETLNLRKVKNSGLTQPNHETTRTKLGSTPSTSTNQEFRLHFCNKA